MFRKTPRLARPTPASSTTLLLCGLLVAGSVALAAPASAASPVAVDDSYTVTRGGTLNEAAPGVLANDSDPDVGDSLFATGLTVAPQHGTLTFGVNGSFTYVHDAGAATSDTFTYLVTDGHGGVDTANVTITVTTPNGAPVALGDSVTVAEGGTATTLTGGATSVLTNDTDPEGDVLTAVLVTGPTNGTLTLNANGTFGYTHHGSETTSDSFTYRTSDGTALSNVVPVTVTVTPVNDPPVAVGDAYSVAEDSVLTVTAANKVTLNDTDAESSALTAVLVSGPSHGTLTLNADGTFTYTPQAGYDGADSFTYRADDGSSSSNVATVSLTVTEVDDAPVAVGDSFIVAEGGTATTLTGGATSVLTNDTDPEGDVLTAVLVTGPTNGTLMLNANGTFGYTHDGSETTSDSFTYLASDETSSSNTVTVSVTVTPVNDAPVAVGDVYSVAEDSVLTVTAANKVTLNDTDAESSALTAVLVSGPSHGTLTLNADGTFTYTPQGGYDGADSFTYRADDGSDGSNVVTVTLTVTGVNDAPVAVGDAYSVAEDSVLTVTAADKVTLNDTDADGDALTTTVASAPVHGTLSLNPDGTFVYTPAADFHGTDSFTYVANDGQDDSVPGTVTITVADLDDAPTIGRIANRVIERNRRTGRLSFTVADDRTSATGLEVSATSSNARLVPASAIQLTGTAGRRQVSITPRRDRVGSTVITLTVTDGEGGRAQSRFTLTVRLGPPCTVSGTSGDDVLVGTPGRDVICGRAGNDVLRGLGGDDVVRGGTGDDRILGGAGDDVLRGFDGDDVIRGEVGDDRLFGGLGRDVLRGGAGHDRLVQDRPPGRVA
ncbi:Ig-like domain-containing protein [Nocardioides sp. 503]|uniref:Ig-like domain-containing protein n=1 Tax=Nocardioides sp. 503 TaxID=2508326 RepID=UPI0014308B26|nr:Ig-like domain-containing protein [Nocardioides sp. 503]